jgi:hypothetical protein
MSVALLAPLAGLAAMSIMLSRYYRGPGSLAPVAP